MCLTIGAVQIQKCTCNDGAFDAVNRISANCGGVSPKIGSLKASLMSENRRSFSLDESSVTSKPNSCANARITVPDRGDCYFPSGSDREGRHQVWTQNPFALIPSVAACRAILRPNIVFDLPCPQFARFANRCQQSLQT